MYSFAQIESARLLHEEKMKKRWASLESDLIKRTTQVKGADIASALREMHALMTDGDVVSWFANLYDPETGGFYYSNSARDTEGFLPDLESTRQTMSFFFSSGMANEVGCNMASALPDWVATPEALMPQAQRYILTSKAR